MLPARPRHRPKTLCIWKIAASITLPTPCARWWTWAMRPVATPAEPLWCAMEAATNASSVAAPVAAPRTFSTFTKFGCPILRRFCEGWEGQDVLCSCHACTANTSSASQKNYRTPPLAVALGVSADCVPTRNLVGGLSVRLAHRRSHNAASVGVLHEHEDAQLLALPCRFHLDLQILAEFAVRLQRTQLHELHQHGDML